MTFNDRQPSGESPFVMPDVIDRLALAMSSWGDVDWWEYNAVGLARKEERWVLRERSFDTGRHLVLRGKAEFDPTEFTKLIRQLRKLPLGAPMQGEDDVFATDLPDWVLECEGGGHYARVSGYGVTFRGLGDNGPGAQALKRAISLIQALGRRVIWEQRIVPDDDIPEGAS
ncbi:MAG TPA: hypothetical protein VGZ22_08865 [Isosphaeraceae bacterium]|jgi:hypothetical protein|nr:hypothetical protein [Isosphaeraceae bacterium]